MQKVSALELEEGAKAYQKCASCHLPDAAGIPAVFPPLRNRIRSIAQSKPGRNFLVMTLTSGLMGAINVQGSPYMGVMPAQLLDPTDAANVLNYLQTLGDYAASEPFDAFSAQEIIAVRERYPDANGQFVAELRKQVPELTKTP